MQNLNMICPLGGTGYGIASINIYKELTKQLNISLFPIGSANIDNKEDGILLQEGVEKQKYFDYEAPCLKIWHQFDLALKAGRGKFIAFPFFETDTFDDREKYHLSYPDKLIVSSNWAKDIIKKNNINTDVDVAPLGVDTTIFNPNIFDTESTQDLPYIFITIGKWERRKSHDTIIELFNRAFEEKDNVELWMVTFNPFLNKEKSDMWLHIAQNCKLSSKIKVFQRLQTHNNVAEILSYSSCGIYISRAEGWNMELLETMAMDKPVIATNYSAHTEYCNSQNSFLIDITEMEPAKDDMWFNGTGNWAKITPTNEEQIIEYMRYVYKNNIRSNPEGLKTAHKLSWNNTANKIIKSIYNATT